MNLRNFAVLAAIPAIAVGCSTVFDAREAQKAVADKGSGAESRAVERIDLRGSSLERLVGFAMTNRPSVVLARLAVENARLALKEVAADAPLLSTTPWTSPHLSVGGGYDAASESSASRLGWHTEGSASAALSLDLLVWDFGRYSAKADAAAENVIAAEEELIQEGYVVFDDVTSAYFNLLEADALLEVARTNEYEFAEHLRQARDMLSAGEAQRLDVTRAQMDLSKARQSTVAASNLVVTSGAELMRALGIDADRGSREDVLPVRSDLFASVVRGFDGTGYGVGEAFDLARTNAPVTAIARARLRAARSRVDLAIADLLPTVSASASLSWADPFWFWSWGVGAAQTLFTGFRKTTALEQAVVSMKSAASEVDEAEQKLSLAVELAIAERDNAKEALAAAWASVKSARENYDTVKAQYHEGDASRIDFTDAIGGYATAVGSCITAFYRGQIAEAKLFAIVGRVPAYHEEVVKEGK